jgi:hypothetical protein
VGRRGYRRPARLGEHYADIADTHDLLCRSDLDWTTVCCPYRTDKPATGDYRVAYDRSVRGGWRIGRAYVAAYLLRAVTEPAISRHCVAIAH